MKERAERDDLAWLCEHGKVYIAAEPCKNETGSPGTPEEREIYDRCRREFTGADLQQYLQPDLLKNSVPINDLLTDLEAIQADYDCRKKAQ